MSAVILSITKYFFITLGTIYGYRKILHLVPQKNSYWYTLFFSLLTTLSVSGVRNFLPPLTLYIEILFLMLFCYRLINTHKSFSLSLCITCLSFGITYALFTLSFFIISAVFYFCFANYIDIPLVHSAVFFFTGLLQLLFLFLLFQIPRLKKGIPDIEKTFSSDIGILISISLLFIASLPLIKKDNFLLSLSAFFLTITIGIFILLWWRKYLLNTYIHKAQHQTIQILENTIAEQKEELEKLSKIIHKDNKLVGALYLSVRELYASTRTEQGLELQKELELLSEERKGILQSYENSGEHLPKTKVFSTDVIISYLFRRALEKDIHFDVTITGDIRFMTESVLEEALLNTLLADLGENAIIATAKAERRNILLSLGVRDGQYCIDVFDSGADFNAGVIENLGRRRYTTHKSEGGSGIGLMTTLEILEKKKGSFELEELRENCLFTKRVSIVLDRCHRVRISSNRKELLTACEKRGRDIVLTDK